MHARIAAILLFAIFGLAVTTTPAHAVTVFCVSNSQELQLDLSLAKQNKGDTVIKVVRGATPYILNTASDTQLYGALSVLGGYAAGCATRIINPANTIIDFAGTSALFQTYFAPSNSLLQFDGVTLQNGTGLVFDVGTYNCCTPDNAGNLRVSNSRITNFQTTDNDGVPTPFYQGVGTVGFFGDSAQFVLLNLQIDHIAQLGTSPCAVELGFGGNTVGNLSYLTVDLSSGKGFCFETSQAGQEGGDFQFNVSNSIFWASDLSQSPLRGRTTGDPIHINLVNDIFHSFQGDGDVTFSSPSAPALSDPLWVDAANGNYHLAPNTFNAVNAAINTGTASVPSGNPLFDIEGNTRQFGAHPDRGAYESPYSDVGTFTVTNASDCGTVGCGSLRGSMLAANSSFAATVSIHFAIPVQCPAVINLGSPLPDVTKPTSIDGYTQSGSAPNTDSEAFNATLCVVLQPANSVYYALRVPAAAGSDVSLNVSGLAIGYFPIGVELLGGANHQFAGNQFGGLINNNTFQLFGSDVASIYMDVPSGQTIIGGSDAANRNVFLNASVFVGLPASAIQIGYHVDSAANACQIIGNNIGVLDDGTFGSRNTDYGIYVQGNGCVVRNNRIVGVNKDAIFIDSSVGGGNRNVVQNNTLGLVPYGFDFSTSNGGAGIRVSGSHNVIGQPPIAGNGVSTYFNLIENMDGGAVVISGGTGNTVRGNSMFGNGSVGDELSIDLGGNGPTPNDYADSDGGANNLQNYPTLHGLAWQAPFKPGTTNVTGTMTGILHTFIGQGFYQIDAYYSHDCNASGRGSAERWVGSVDYVFVPAQSFTSAFSVPVVIPDYDPNHGVISVTATNTTNGEGSTSELSSCFSVDTIFKDGGDVF